MGGGDPAAAAALIVPTNPAFTALFAAIFLKERMGPVRALGVALSTLSPLALTAYVMLAGSLPVAIPAWFEHETLSSVTWQGWTAMAYQVAFGTVLPFLWFNEGVKGLGAARAAQFINLVPPLAVAEAILILGEPFTPALIVGAALVVAGLYLTNRPR